VGIMGKMPMPRQARTDSFSFSSLRLCAFALLSPSSPSSVRLCDLALSSSFLLSCSALARFPPETGDYGFPLSRLDSRSRVEYYVCGTYPP